MKYLSFITLFFAIFIFFGCGNKEKSSIDNTNSTIQKPLVEKVKLHSVNADDVTFTKNQDRLRLNNNTNKIILLNFFATWCPPCKAEIPHLVNLQKRYKDNLKIISILLEEDKPDSEVKSFIEYNHINYIITNDKNNFKLSNILGGIQNIPSMILYDKDGKVITHYMGIIPEEMIDSDIKKAIRK